MALEDTIISIVNAVSGVILFAAIIEFFRGIFCLFQGLAKGGESNENPIKASGNFFKDLLSFNKDNSDNSEDNPKSSAEDVAIADKAEEDIKDIQEKVEWEDPRITKLKNERQEILNKLEKNKNNMEKWENMQIPEENKEKADEILNACRNEVYKDCKRLEEIDKELYNDLTEESKEIAAKLKNTSKELRTMFDMALKNGRKNHNSDEINAASTGRREARNIQRKVDNLENKFTKEEKILQKEIEIGKDIIDAIASWRETFLNQEKMMQDDPKKRMQLRLEFIDRLNNNIIKLKKISGEFNNLDRETLREIRTDIIKLSRDIKEPAEIIKALAERSSQRASKEKPTPLNE